jgi:methylphosphotriester-DNA--protein-cysteine methyltransferase
LWITCKTEFRGWRWPLARPKRWTPLFFLDEAVALAAGHRPCAFCRRDDYHRYRGAVGRAAGVSKPLLATELNKRLAAERLRRGRGLVRAHDRRLWSAPYAELPDGTVVADREGAARLKRGGMLFRFDFEGWTSPAAFSAEQTASVLTPPTSVAALRHGYSATLHPSAN